MKAEDTRRAIDAVWRIESARLIAGLDQDRALWDHVLVRRGLAALKRAEALSGGPLAPAVNSA